MSDSVKIFLHDVLPVLTLIFIGVICAIFLIRIAFTIILHFLRKKYAHLKQFTKDKKDQFIRSKKNFPKEDEVLFREKETRGRGAEKINDERPMVSGVQKMSSPAQEEESRELAEVKIVDIVKPVGFWTSMILGQKLTYLISSAQLMNKNSKKGFWVSMVEAQERAQGRQRGRSL